MDDEQPINNDNLGAVLFSEYGSESLIVTSDINNSLSSLEGALCYDETTNELVYVNMIQPNMIASDSMTVSQSVFSTLGNTIPALSELSMFNDGGQFLLLTNGSIIIPNDEDNLVGTNSDPFVLDCVSNVSNTQDKRISVNSKPADQNLLEFGKAQEKRSGAKEKIKVSNDIGVLEDVHHPRLFPKDNDSSIETKKQSSKTRYHCKLCSEEFSLLKEYKVHLLNHHKDKMHKCKYCGNSFNKLKNLILHEAVHNTKDTTCPLASCQKKFKRLASLKAHIKLHEEDDALTCSECGEEFRHQLNLELHYKYQPQCRISPTVQTASADKSLQCKLCDRKFEYVSQYLIHKKEHAKLKKALATKYYKKKTISSAPSSRINRCKTCPKWFLKPSQLIRHMRIHTGERPFECTVCNKAFNQANSLKTHMLKHTGDRPYHCPFCSIGFSQRGNLRQHISRVHSIPKVEEHVYKCVECSCIFKKLCSLNAHKNRVHQKRHYTADDQQMTEETENSITIENGIDDLQEDDLNALLEKKSYVNTITVTLNRENGSVWNQQIFINKKGNNRYFKCSHCPKQSIKLKEIIRHLKFNILGRPFKCDYCSVTFSQHSTFLSHLTLHANATTFPCDICQRSFSTQSELRIHSLTHAKPNDQQMCMSCFKSYPQAEINNHRCITLLRITEENSNLETNKKRGLLEMKDIQKCEKVSLILPPYICSFCNVTYDKCSELKQHLHIHNANLCEICCSLFSTKEKLEEHAVSHQTNDLKHLVCKKCDKQFQTKHTLDTHLKSHDNILVTGFEFKCVQCTRTYKDEHSLKRHAEQMHKMKRQIVSKKLDAREMTTSRRNYEDKANAVGNTEINLVNGLQNSRIVNSSKSRNDYASVHSSSEFLQSDNYNNKIEDPINYDDSSLRHRIQNSSNEITLHSKSVSSDLLTIDSLGDCFLNIQPGDMTVVEADPRSSTFSFSGAVIYRCTKCYQQYTTELGLQKHFQESEACNNGIPNVNSYFYACNTCFLTFKSLPSFFKHLQTHASNNSFSCLYCGAPSKTQGELTQHIAQHALSNEYPCIHCGELSDSTENVKKHITDVHLVSSVDSKKPDARRRKNVGNELLLTEKEKKILASQKPNKYSSISEKVLSSLLKNCGEKDAFDKNHNSDGENDTVSMVKNKKNTSTNAKEKTCSYCGRGFKKMNDLLRHIRTHTGEKPFKCDYCNKCFRVKSILSCHLKTHFTMNNIFCHICNRFFSTVSSLKIHMRLHTGDRPYKCLYCKETFRTSGHRENHQKRHLIDAAKTAQNSEPIMIEIVTMDEDTSTQFIIPEISVPEQFKFKNISLAHPQNSAESKLIQNSSCDNAFQKETDLNTRVNIELLQAPYGCMLCDAKFDDLDIMKTHLSEHTKSEKSTMPSKSTKVNKTHHHSEILQHENKLVASANYDKRKADRNDWLDENSLGLKKNDGMSDFCIIDKSFDLNCCIMPDFLTDDEK